MFILAEACRDSLVQNSAVKLALNAIKTHTTVEKLVDVCLMALDTLLVKSKKICIRKCYFIYFLSNNYFTFCKDKLTRRTLHEFLPLKKYGIACSCIIADTKRSDLTLQRVRIHTTL